MRGRKLGSLNKVTENKRAIQAKTKTSITRKPRATNPKGYISLNDNYRIRLDLSNYILERKLLIGENANVEQSEEPEDGIVAEPGWVLNGYFSVNSLGLAHMLDCLCNEMLIRKLAGKTIKFEKFCAELKLEYEELKKLISSATK
jgi:hypothetical protein